MMFRPQGPAKRSNGWQLQVGPQHLQWPQVQLQLRGHTSCGATRHTTSAWTTSSPRRRAGSCHQTWCANDRDHRPRGRGQATPETTFATLSRPIGCSWCVKINVLLLLAITHANSCCCCSSSCCGSISI